MIIRLFSKEDAKETADLIATTLHFSNRADYSNETIEKIRISHSAKALINRTNGSHIYVVCDGKKIVGCGGISGYLGSKSESILLTIFVLPEYQKRGVGRSILETLEKDEFFLRAERIEIPSSITACEFYKKFGYVYKNNCSVPGTDGCIRLEKYR